MWTDLNACRWLQFVQREYAYLKRQHFFYTCPIIYFTFAEYKELKYLKDRGVVHIIVHRGQCGQRI